MFLTHFFLSLALITSSCFANISTTDTKLSYTITRTPELPFLTFPKAILFPANQIIISEMARGYLSFPLFSYKAPYRISTSPYCTSGSEAIDGDLLLIIDNAVGMVAHYFHFMEHVIGIWNFLTYQEHLHVKKIIFAFAEPSSQDHKKWAGLSNDVTRLVLNALFPNATIALLRDLPSNISLQARKIHVSSRLRSHGIPQAGYCNMNGSAYLLFHPERLRHMRDQVFRHMKITSEPRKELLRITYCKRRGNRTMDPTLEKKLLETIVKETGYPVSVVDFGIISFPEQLQLIANTDLLMGVHGNGLTHLLFLPDHGAVLEYYQGEESAYFRFFSRWRGIAYYGNHNKRWDREDSLSLTTSGIQENVTEIDIPGTIEIIKKLGSRK